MWKQFDPKGAMVGLALFAVLLLVAASFLIPVNVSMKLDLPPARASTR